MSVATRLKNKSVGTSERPWNSAQTLPNGRELIAQVVKTVDSEFAVEAVNAVDRMLALHATMKDYEARLLAKKAPLAAQRKAMLAALAALEL